LKRLLLALLATAGTAAAQNTNDSRDVTTNTRPTEWEERQRLDPSDSSVVLPALPKNENLIEFWVSNSTAFRFFIDTASLSVDKDGVVRYTLVARSPSGVANISYEAMRCTAGTYKIYAYERAGQWSAATSEWRPVEPNAIQRWHNELRLRYFCADRRGSLQSREEGLDALRRGGHPGAGARGGY
jgi:CNP1-like family